MKEERQLRIDKLLENLKSEGIILPLKTTYTRSMVIGLILRLELNRYLIRTKLKAHGKI